MDHEEQFRMAIAKTAKRSEDSWVEALAWIMIVVAMAGVAATVMPMDRVQAEQNMCEMPDKASE